MSRAISQNKIIESTLDGIDESMKIYQEWSGNECLEDAPEYLITIKIAENISKIQGGKYITLEDNVDYILNSANAKGQGKVSNKVRANGRIDIVFWWAYGKPRAIIEVKNSVFKLGHISHDIERIREALKRKKSKNTLQFGLISFYIDRNYKKSDAKEEVKNRIDKIFNEMKEKYSDLTCELSSREKDIYEDDNGTHAWSSVVFLLKLKA